MVRIKYSKLINLVKKKSFLQSLIEKIYELRLDLYTS
jgi:hypothetical protein